MIQGEHSSSPSAAVAHAEPLSDAHAHDDRSLPGVAFICNAIPPYRIHLHRRITQELKQIRIWTLSTHRTGGDRWQGSIPQDIHPILLGQDQLADGQSQPRYLYREWRKAGRIIAWMKQNDIRAVVLHGYNDIGRLRLLRWCDRHRIPCFLFGDSNIHGDKVRGFKRWIKSILLYHVIRQCSGILACGRLGRDYFVRYGADPNRIFYFPYEPDYSLIDSASPDLIDQARRRFQLNPNRRRIVFSARMVSVKRADLLLDAFATLADKRPEWDVVMLGEGPLRPALMQRLAPSLRSRVIWTGFLDDQSMVSSIYRLSDVLVLPSDYEPWALVVNEAAAAGLAIVASHVVGAAAELVQEGINGYLFPAGDRAALTECLLRTTDPQRIDALKAASPSVLDQWRIRADPVQGLRQALVAARVIAF